METLTISKKGNVSVPNNLLLEFGLTDRSQEYYPWYLRGLNARKEFVNNKPMVKVTACWIKKDWSGTQQDLCSKYLEIADFMEITGYQF